MWINSCTQLKYIEHLNCSFIRMNEVYIVLPLVFHFHGIYCCEDLLKHSLWKILGGPLSWTLLVNMVFKFPMYAVHNFKAKRFGNYLPFNFHDRCSNQQGNLHRQIFVLLMSY